MDAIAIIPQYQLIEKLYAGSRTVVYRGIREADQLGVVVKLLQREYPTFNELLQFRNQYTIAKNLENPGIIHPYSLETYRNSYALVMEDFGGTSLREYIQNQPLTLKEFLEIAIQLADILIYLHHHQIIHKDIKPANILIHPETKQVKIIDFSIASLLPKETQEIKNPNVLEGTLAYIAPEQTGRMNRGIDYRADFYALGVTFFELLTGELPFLTDDPMELLHCHIAKQPDQFKIQKSKFKKAEVVPQVLCDMTLKLMAKNAESRYQSALGLKYDLETCLEKLSFTDKIETFKIATRDVCDRFLIREKLYGRENEVQQLLAAFERVANPPESPRGKGGELMLVAGFSGIGKTAVVNEVHKPIVKQRGYFIKGKFDQFNRNIPFSAFVQAFRNLMMQLLTESDQQLHHWKTKILEAVGDNGQVIIEVIPELEKIIGQQIPAPKLSGNAVQNRFNLLFQKFVELFTTKEHPLVMFLDDLQWADSASLKLMQLLMSESSGGYLLIIGAYRDNEVFAAHPLMFTLEEIRKAQATINTITLTNLSLLSLNELVADTLSCSLEVAHPLTQLIYQKSKGNPFFSTQFLKAIYEDNLITFDEKLGYWQCDIVAVKSLSLTDDVVEFMALQLQKLPTVTQNILKLAACIGNQFDLATLAIVSEQSELETSSDLWKALQEGFILPQSEIYKFYIGQETEDKLKSSQTITYKFLHDRIQQAAYSLIPDGDNQAIHQRIGELLLNNTPVEKQEERIFEIVNQLNIGVKLIIKQSDRDQLAQLNLLAGQKAKLSTAYTAAMEYISFGIQLLAKDSWERKYTLALALHEEAAAAAYLIGEFDKVEEFALQVERHAKVLLDRVKSIEIQIQSYLAQSRFDNSIQTAIALLNLLGIKLSPQASQTQTLLGLGKITLKLLGKSPLSLIDLPNMTGGEQLAAIRILASTNSTAYIARPDLLPPIILSEVNLSMQYGNAAESAFGYAWYGLIQCGIIGNIQAGYEFGQLALQVLETFHAQELKARTFFIVETFVNHWHQHTQETIAPLTEAYQAGLETGDIEYASWASYTCSFHGYLIGQELSELEKKMGDYAEVYKQFKQEKPYIYINSFRQAIKNLLGQSTNTSELSGSVYDAQTIRTSQEQSGDRTGLSFSYANELILCYVFENYAQASQAAIHAITYLDGVTSAAIVPVVYFYDALVQLNLYPIATAPEQKKIIKKVNSHQKKLKKWAHSAPKNHQHKFDLIEAERHRILHQKNKAMELYDRSISLAKENGYIQEEAIANELAAKFYLELGKEKVAQAYMQEAYYCYAKWGAKTKTDDLEKRYPQLLQPILQQQKLSLNSLETIAVVGSNSTSKSTPSTSISDILDFVSVIKVAQVISRDIQLDELITNLTKIILENAGAKKCILILPEENEWQVQVITSINPSDQQLITVISSQLLDDSPEVPVQLIQYVKHTLEPLVIDNCQTEISGVIDDYMLQYQPKSALCVPILNQGHLVGIIYLENSLTQGVFTTDRLLVINFLCTQAAISLENARLYQQSQQAFQDLQKAQLQLVQSEKMSALGNLVAGIAHEINNPVGFIAGNIPPALNYLRDIFDLLDLYKQEYRQSNVVIADKIDEIDLEYIQEDLPKLIASMELGINRIRDISTSLRTFSRADQQYKVACNIHEGINSTILILKHRLKANETRPAIEVITDYGNLPEVECFAGQLNQVFMNLLANAIDALEESNQGRSYQEITANVNCIKIRTFLQDNYVNISIADNGNGMMPEVKERIFDHLFTTKGVGQGTGLGLAIARQIVVEKHGGQITVESEVNKGTQFAIAIPI
ncbi:AAA family ATPase [Nostoc sp. UHCC 0252]|uniref:trifunctional serine/threonine-protein kinase/ATP-binding protein/sensor histidine kinase n=1 Tax=Nostoc sp. UHCC 0252 TaxID=3110241 RepID=UPI002B2014B7|nr:AAA family ATPase [Nostoc sp. UHCC 0252]MEA5602912.1 AAA family ATPase [Nostoc sp. UHCC 0252]